MFCTKCGKHLPESAIFCTACGAAHKAPLDYSGSIDVTTSQKTDSAHKSHKKKQSRKPLTPPAVGKRVITVFLCIFMAISLIIASLIGIVRYLFTEETLYNILDDIKFGEVNLSTDINNPLTLTETINQSLLLSADSEQLDDSAVFQDEDIDNIFKTKEVKKFIVDTIVGYSNHFIYGKSLKPISAEAIADFVIAQQELIFEKSGKYFYFESRENMIAEIGRYFDFTPVESLQNIEKVLGFSTSPIPLVFTTGYYIILASAAFFLILILLINCKNLSACLTKIGTTAVIFAIYLGMIGVGCCAAISATNKLPFENIITAVLSPIIDYFLIWGAIAFVIGLAFILLRKFWLKPYFEKPTDE